MGCHNQAVATRFGSILASMLCTNCRSKMRSNVFFDSNSSVSAVFFTMSLPLRGGQVFGVSGGGDSANGVADGEAPAELVHLRASCHKPKRGRPVGTGVGRGKQKTPAAAVTDPSPSCASDAAAAPVAQNQVALEAVNIVRPPRLRDCNADYVEKCLKSIKNKDRSVQERMRAEELDRVLTPAEQRAHLWRVVCEWDPPHNTWQKYGKSPSFIRLSSTRKWTRTALC
jgi:hypothetical protein